jgi:hypothetical protein
MEIGPNGGTWRLGAYGRRRIAAGRVGAVPPGAKREDERDEGSRDERRALVPPARVAETLEEPTRIVRFRSHAPFVAQLIASRDAHPDLRARRRAEPAVAADAYERTRDRPSDLPAGYLIRTAL